MSKRSGLADSPFFADPTRVASKAAETQSSVPSVPPVRDVPPVRPVRPTKRVLKHHPFDIYVDQLESLRELKTQAMRRGEEVSMASMVRKALDRYIGERRK